MSERLKVLAAVHRAPRKPLTIEPVQLSTPSPTDVIVRIEATSICHTDLEAWTGALAMPLPMVLGHEGAGVVESVGSQVTALEPGQRVVVHWNPHCGTCFYCQNDQLILCEQFRRGVGQGNAFDGEPRISIGDEAIHQLLYLGTFAEAVVVDAQMAVPIPDDLPSHLACLLGCGVMTGFGAATNVSPVRAGSTVAVVGCGAIGLSAIAAARMAGAAHIVAVDLNSERLDAAMTMGATAQANPSSTDPIAVVHDHSDGRGADHVFEGAGNEAAFRLSVDLARPGGDVVWLGKVEADAQVSFTWSSLAPERRVVRSSYGGCRPHRDVPMLAAAYRRGALDLNTLVTDRIRLPEINNAFAALERGETIRTVIDFP